MWILMVSYLLGGSFWQAVTKGEAVVSALLAGPSVNPSLEKSSKARWGSRDKRKQEIHTKQ